MVVLLPPMLLVLLALQTVAAWPPEEVQGARDSGGLCSVVGSGLVAIPVNQQQ